MGFGGDEQRSHDRAFLREVATRVWAFDGTHLKDFEWLANLAPAQSGSDVRED